MRSTRMKDAVKVGYMIDSEDLNKLRLTANAYTGGNRSRVLRVAVRKFLEYLSSITADKNAVYAFLKNVGGFKDPDSKHYKMIIWAPEEFSLNLGKASNLYDISINCIVRGAIRFGYQFSDQINWSEK